MENYLLIVVLFLLTAEIGILYYFLKYNSNFLKQIQSIKGIQLDALDIGDKAPFFREYSNNKEKVIAKDLFKENKTFVLFISTNCPVCKSLLGDMNVIAMKYDLNFLVINSDNLSNDDHVTKQLSDRITYIRSNQIPSLYFIRKVPHAMMIDEQGQIVLTSYVSNPNALYNMLLNEENLLKSIS